MYGKHFASTYTGSMFGAGADVFAVWGYVIANASADGTVELNPKMLAATLGMDESSVESAIKYLCTPDGGSRSPKNEGMRLIREGVYQYAVTNHETYRNIANEVDRREYNRVKKQESRSRNNVKQCQTMSAMSAQVEVEVEVEEEEEVKEKNLKQELCRAEKKQRDRHTLTDDEFVESLKKNPAYTHVDIFAELGKMDAWLSTRPGRKKTRRFVVNWLNRVDKPMEGTSNGKPKRKSVVTEFFDGIRASQGIAVDTRKNGEGIEIVRNFLPAPKDNN